MQQGPSLEANRFSSNQEIPITAFTRVCVNIS